MRQKWLISRRHNGRARTDKLKHVSTLSYLRVMNSNPGCNGRTLYPPCLEIIKVLAPKEPPVNRTFVHYCNRPFFRRLIRVSPRKKCLSSRIEGSIKRGDRRLRNNSLRSTNSTLSTSQKGLRQLNRSLPSERGGEFLDKPFRVSFVLLFSADGNSQYSLGVERIS